MLRKAVGIVILFKNQEILLAKRGDKEDRMPGLWENVGGEVEKGEDWADAVKRELKEEIGSGNLRYLSIADPYVLEWTDKPRSRSEDSWKTRIYIARSSEKFKVEIDRDEDGFLDEIRWFKVSDLPWGKLTSYCQKDYRKLGRKKVSPFEELN